MKQLLFHPDEKIKFVNDWPFFCEFMNYLYDIHCYCQFLEKIVQQVYF